MTRPILQLDPQTAPDLAAKARFLAYALSRPRELRETRQRTERDRANVATTPKGR